MTKPNCRSDNGAWGGSRALADGRCPMLLIVGDDEVGE